MRTPTLDALAGGSWFAPRTPRLDASLGMEGLPQSATGQTALLTGRNAAQAMRTHYGPWPGPTLKAFLDQGNLFRDAVEAFGVQAVRWAFAYPDGFFDALEKRRLRLNAPAYAATQVGVALPTLDAYRNGTAVASDLDGSYFATLGHRPLDAASHPTRRAYLQGDRLAKLAGDAIFTFADVWITDRAGHLRDMTFARTLAARIDAFVEGIVAGRAGHLTLLVTSDHGNMEDLGHRRHTTNPVPLLSVGPQAWRFADATSLLDVAPAVRDAWHARDAHQAAYVHEASGRSERA